VGALSEVAPPDLRRGFPAGTSQFRYKSPLGPVSVVVESSGAAIKARFEPAANEPEAIELEEETPPPAAPTPARGLPMPATWLSEGSAEVEDSPRSAMYSLLALLPQRGASDLHLAVGAPPALRIQGTLVRVEAPPMHAAQIEQLLAAIAPDRRRGELAVGGDFCCDTPAGRFRVHVFSEARGLAVAVRHVPAEPAAAETLGIPSGLLQLTGLRAGLVLVASPAGNGRSTTLAALADHAARTRAESILSLEAPVELRLPHRLALVRQREASETGFEPLLRAALREDADVLICSEVPDVHCAALLLELAEDRLVFAALRAGSATAALERLLALFPPERLEQARWMLADTLRGASAQVLLRGARGRAAAFELVLGTPAVGALVREGKTYQVASALQAGRAQGMVPLADSVAELVKAKRVDAADASARLKSP
jgi:twitching motility protein PilT